MTSFGPDLHVFIIRSRREPREIPGASPEWRFWIEHHPGGQQRNLKDFAAVVQFITLYMPDLRMEREQWERLAASLVAQSQTRED